MDQKNGPSAPKPPPKTKKVYDRSAPEPPLVRETGLKAGCTSVAPKMDHFLVQVVQNRPSINNGRLGVCARSAPESPLVQKRGSQARGSPLLRQNGPTNGPTPQNGPKTTSAPEPPSPPKNKNGL